MLVNVKASFDHNTVQVPVFFKILKFRKQALQAFLRADPGGPGGPAPA